MSLPLVSVCIPTYNGSEFLGEALNSIKVQNYPNLEVIISDDHSADSTLHIAEAFKLEVDFPVYIQHNLRSGIGANWNNCVKLANGKFIKFLFQDDLLLPNCIIKMVQIATRYPDLGIISAKRKLLFEEGLEEYEQNWLKLYKNLQKDLIPVEDNLYILDKKLFKNKNFLKSPLNKVGEPSTILFQRSLVKKVGFFREDLNQILDYEFYFRVLKWYRIAVINEPLVVFRLHLHQATRRNIGDSAQDIEAFDKILFKNYFFYLSFTQQKSLIRRMIKRALKKTHKSFSRS